ncbi:MAG: hypothetical protein JWM76_1088 [Pseudonocardiales bacterium]|nr:hypothetical protein [Pseudonocardiales bacterium]
MIAVTMPTRGLSDNFAELARNLSRQPTLLGIHDAILHETVRRIPGAEEASITVRRRRHRFETVASTGSLATTVDALQYAVGEGPSLSCLADGRAYRSDDVRTDARWPQLGHRVADVLDGVSVMSCLLFLDGEADDREVHGALNLFSSQPAAFSDETSLLAALATHGAVALTSFGGRAETDLMRSALESNRTIGVAIGILMATHRVTRDDAFEMLRIASQEGHHKLLNVAVEVVETGQLGPGPSQRPAA